MKFSPDTNKWKNTRKFHKHMRRMAQLMTKTFHFQKGHHTNWTEAARWELYGWFYIPQEDGSTVTVGTVSEKRLDEAKVKP